jgi:hypothetical protein
LASDAVLGFYPHMEIVYAAVVLVTSIGFLGKDASALRIGCLALRRFAFIWLRMQRVGLRWSVSNYSHRLGHMLPNGSTVPRQSAPGRCFDGSPIVRRASHARATLPH